jgi:hypothetical protein
LQTVRGGVDDYKQLARFHYREGSERAGPFTSIFALKATAAKSGVATVGVIVYCMPTPGLELRNVATNNLFTGFDRATQLSMVNKTIRCISRVIIEPRFRALGLASRLVRETMPKIGVAIVEAMAVMGLVNPFFEKAGMTSYTAKMPARCVQLVEALSLVGIENKELIDGQKVHKKVQQLGQAKATFIEREFEHFLQSYGKRRYMPAGQERTRYILTKLTARPVYYIWFNPDLGVLSTD